jgi:hypothetical protein
MQKNIDSCPPPVGGDVGDLRAPTTYLKDVNSRPPGGIDGDLGVPTSYLKYVDGDPLGGINGDLRPLTINAKNVDGGAPRRRCRRSESIHHQRKRRRCGPLGGGDGCPRVHTTYIEAIDGGPHSPLGGLVSIQDSKSVL